MSGENQIKERCGFDTIEGEFGRKSEKRRKNPSKPEAATIFSSLRHYLVLFPQIHRFKDLLDHYFEDPDGSHDEASWGRRVALPLMLFFPPEK